MRLNDALPDHAVFTHNPKKLFDLSICHKKPTKFYLAITIYNGFYCCVINAFLKAAVG